LSPNDALELPIGDCISVLKAKRAIDYEQFKIEEDRVRRACFYGSSWLDHSGKTASDLYPLPWEGDKREKVDVDTGHEIAVALQKKLKEKDGIKKEGISSRGA